MAGPLSQDPDDLPVAAAAAAAAAEAEAAAAQAAASTAPATEPMDFSGEEKDCAGLALGIAEHGLAAENARLKQGAALFFVMAHFR